MQQRGTGEESNFAYIADLLVEEMEEITFSGVLCRRGEIRRQLSAANKQKKKRFWMNEQHEETEIKTRSSVFLVRKCQVSERLSFAANLESCRMTENLRRRICGPTFLRLLSHKRPFKSDIRNQSANCGKRSTLRRRFPLPVNANA